MEELKKLLKIGFECIDEDIEIYERDNFSVVYNSEIDFFEVHLHYEGETDKYGLPKVEIVALFEKVDDIIRYFHFC